MTMHKRSLILLMMAVVLVVQGVMPMVVKAEDYAGQTEIDKLYAKFETMTKDAHASSTDKYVVFREFIAAMEKYEHPIKDIERTLLQTLRMRAAREELAHDASTFMDLMSPTGTSNPKGPAVTDADYERVIKEKQDEVNKKKKERDRATSGKSDEYIQSLPAYKQCLEDEATYHTEPLMKPEELCKRGMIITMCQSERCDGYRSANDTAHYQTCSVQCADDVKAGIYGQGSKDIDRLTSEIQSLEKGIAELQKDRALFFGGKNVMAKRVLVTTAACRANLEKSRLASLKAIAAKRDASLKEAKTLGTVKLRLAAKKKAEASYSTEVKAAAKKFVAAKAQCKE